MSNKVIRMINASLISLLVLLGFGSATLYLTTPSHVRGPETDHYHFRMQIITGSGDINFADSKFQRSYDKASCDARTPNEPIHFHDNKSQVTHIHWNGTTGGEVLKYYGWNYIGGPDQILGVRFSKEAFLKPVFVHGSILPVPKPKSLFVYTGDATSHKKRELSEFLHQDLEVFFGRKSSISLTLIPAASAHEGTTHEPAEENGRRATTAPTGIETTDQRLARINNLLGNMVIFATDQEPPAEEVARRFNQLEPLTDSTCGG